MDGGSGIVTGWQNKLQVALSRVLLETVMANQHAKKAAPQERTRLEVRSVREADFGVLLFKRVGPATGKARAPMKIATFNVNGVNGRLPVPLRWLAQSQPDIACLQELKAPQERFPAAALADAGYGAIWHGQKAGMAAILRRGEAAR